MGMGGFEFGAATQDLTSDMFEGYRVGAGTMPIKIQQVTLPGEKGGADTTPIKIQLVPFSGV